MDSVVITDAKIYTDGTARLTEETGTQIYCERRHAVMAKCLLASTATIKAELTGSGDVVKVWDE